MRFLRVSFDGLFAPDKFAYTNNRIMSDYSVKATVTLRVNSQDGQKSLLEMQQQAKRLTAELNAARAAGDKSATKQLTRDLERTNRAIDRLRADTLRVNDVMRRLDSATPRELNRALRTMRTSLQGMERGTAAWNRQTAQIRAVKAELDKVNAAMATQRTRAEGLGASFKSMAAGAVAGIASATGALALGRDAIEKYASMQGEEANVRKYTGMSEADVKALNDEFKKIDTRTPREELNKLAQEAGRLGKSSVDDVLGFVRAADKVNVALDDLGDGATLTLSKLTGIFGDEARYGTEQALLKTGAVINELSQNCSASAPYLADFASRVGGIGAQSGMTVQQIMAFAAVLDTQNLAVEAAGTAVGQLITKIYKDPAKIAKAAGLEVKEFAQLVKTDMNGALIMLFEHLKGMGGMERLAGVFGDMKTDGARAVPVLSALAGHIDELKAQQQAANDAFEKGTSLISEFEVQNTTAQAKLDKSRAKLTELRVELGERLYPAMHYLYAGGELLLSALARVVGFVSENRRAFAALTAAIVAYNATVALAAVRTKALAVAQTAQAVASATWTKAVNIAKVAAIGVTQGAGRAAAAMRLFGMASTAVPWLRVAGVVTSVAAAVFTLSRNTEAMSEAQKRAASAAGALESNLDTERRSINELFGRLKYCEKGTKQYESAKQAIINQYGQYLTGLGREIESLNDVEGAYNAVTRAAERSARARGLAEANQRADDARNEVWKNTGGDILEGLRETRMGDNGRALSEREVQEYAQMLSESQMRGAGPSLKKTLAVLGIYRDRGGKWRAHKGGSSTLADALNERQDAQRAWRVETAENDATFNTMESRLDGLTTAGVNDAIGKIDRMASVGKYRNVKLANGQKLLISNGEDARVMRERLLDFLADGLDVPVAASSVSQQPEVVIPELPDDSSGDGKNGRTDKFKAEKDWRELEEARALLARETGQIIDEKGQQHLFTREDYLRRMEEIERQFYEKQLARTDLTAAERVKIEADKAKAMSQATEQELSGMADDAEKFHDEQLAAIKQNYLDELISTEAYHRALEDEEERYQRELMAIYGEGTNEYAKAHGRLQDMLVKQAEDRRKKTDSAAKGMTEDEIRERYFGGGAVAQKEKYNAAMSALDAVRASELEGAANDSERLAVEKKYQEARLALARLYNQQIADDTTTAYAGAISKLGDWMEGEGGQALMGALGFVVNDMGALFSQLTEGIRAELEIQTAAITARYDREITAAEGNTAKIKRLEAKKEREIAAAKQEANRKAFGMQVVQAVAQTAMAGLNAYTSTLAIPIVGPALAPAAMALAIATGLVQVAAIKKQQEASEAQGYMEGGFTAPGRRDKVAGVVHAGEWVASQALVNSPQARPLIDALEYAQRTNTIGSLRAADVSRRVMPASLGAPVTAAQPATFVSATTSSGESESASLHLAINRLVDRLDEPFVTVNTVTGDHGMQHAQDEYDRLIKNKSPRKH